MSTKLKLSVPSDTGDSNPQSESESPQLPEPQLPSLSFSSDRKFFSTFTRRGLGAIFLCHPFSQTFRHHTGVAIRAADTLFDPHTCAVVGDGSHPSFPANTIHLWSSQESRLLGVLGCSSAVISVRVRPDIVVAVMERAVEVFGVLPEMGRMRMIKTVGNAAGLCAAAEGEEETEVVVVLGRKEGWVRVELCNKGWESVVFRAHDSEIACLGVTQHGRFVATASVKGTLVRVFRTYNGALLQEVRRGVSKAEIHCLAFSETAQWLAVSSDKGTVHVFSLNVNFSATSTTRNNQSQSQRPSNYTNTLVAASISSLAFVKGVIPKYLSSDQSRSVAKFRHPRDASKSIVAFGHVKDTIIVLSNNGSFYRCQFDPVKGGNMTQLERHNFLHPSELLD